MDFPRILLLYARSRLNIAVTAACAGGALIFSGLLGAPLGLSLAVFLLLYGGVSAAALRSKAGARSVLEEKDRERQAGVSVKIEAARKNRRRLSHLRIADPEVAEAVRGFIFLSGEYLEACLKHDTYSPRANELIGETLEILGDYLRAKSGQAAGRHFGVETGPAVPDLTRRTIDAIETSGRLVRQATREISGGLDAGDRMDIREDLS